MRRIVTVVVVALGALAANGPSRSESGALSLDEALRRAEAASPRLAAARFAVSAAEAEERQARRWPNPELDFEYEDFGGSGSYEGFDVAEQTLALSQTIEVGGKRSSRRAEAAASRRIVQLEADAARAGLAVEVARVFRSARLAAERAALARDQVELAERLEATIRARVDAGKAARLEALGAEAATASARAASRRAEREQRASWIELASLIGKSSENPPPFEGRSSLPPELPSADALLARAAEAPGRGAELAEQELARARLRGARAERMPDPSVFAGFRRFEESGDNAWLAGVSLPLPVLDRRRGAIAAAEDRLSAAELNAREAWRARRARIEAARESLAAARDQVALLEESVIPTSQEAYALNSEGYRQGKLTYLDVIEARRVLAENQLQRLDVLEEGLEALSELELEIEGLFGAVTEERP